MNIQIDMHTFGKGYRYSPQLGLQSRPQLTPDFKMFLNVNSTEA